MRINVGFDNEEEEDDDEDEEGRVEERKLFAVERNCVAIFSFLCFCFLFLCFLVILVGIFRGYGQFADRKSVV